MGTPHVERVVPAELGLADLPDLRQEVSCAAGQEQSQAHAAEQQVVKVYDEWRAHCAAQLTRTEHRILLAAALIGVILLQKSEGGALGMGGGGMSGFMTGRFKVSGDMSVALKLQRVL